MYVRHLRASAPRSAAPVALLALLPLLACVHPAAVPTAPAAPPAPHLPAPVADLYVRHVGQPVDPLVAQVLGTRPWEEVLSGAAAGVALKAVNRIEVDLARARWAAVRAGYPYPVDRVDIVHVAHDAVPALPLPTSGDIGLVRARGPDDDIWVVLSGRGGPELPAIPREAQVGDSIALGELSWRAAGPAGDVREVAGSLVLDRAGEWLLQARQGDTVVATLPVYVGASMPEEAPVGAAVSGQDAEEATFNAVAEVWKWYGREAPVRDTGIDSVARVRLRQVQDGAPGASPAVLLRRAGFVDGASGAECKAPTLAECIEQMWWSPEQHAVFAAEYRALGVATQTEPGGVRVVVMAAR